MKNIYFIIILMLGFTLETMAQKSCPNNKHPHMIDLGLPSGTKWACCNIGASTPEGYGNYYRWAETTPSKEGDTHATYPYMNVDIGENIASTKSDVATTNWGLYWRIPTKDQIMELVHFCTYKWTTQNGVNGGKVTGPNGSVIFLPASGSRSYSNGKLYYVGSRGYYWSASPLDSSKSYSMYFALGGWFLLPYNRAHGIPVRAVAE